MKTDKLEHFVKDHREKFDSLEPPGTAWDVIEKSLPAEKKNSVNKLWPYAWKVAAAVLIFVSAWMLNDITRQGRRNHEFSKTAKSGNNPALTELSEAEAYYTSRISTKQTELSTYTKQHPEIIADLKKEFAEMDQKKDELRKDLAESNADEKVIEAIILSYRVKLEILDEMLNELRKSDAQKNGEKPDLKDL